MRVVANLGGQRKGRWILVFIAGVMLSLLWGRGVGDHSYNQEAQPERISFIRPADEALPPEVRNWIENSLKFGYLFTNAKEFDGKQYLFISGEPNPFGHEHSIQVQITDIIVVKQERVVAKVEFTKLFPDQKVPGNLYDLVYIRATGLPVKFAPMIIDRAISGARYGITSLAGIHYLPDIVAQSREIKVFAPAPNEIVGCKFSISGAVNTFEATILYRLLGANQNILLSGFTTAGQLAPDFTREPVIPHTVINWRYFTFNLTVSGIVSTGEDLILELYWRSPQDGTIEGLVAIPLKFKLRGEL